MKPAFSTVACPEWTLSRVAGFARRVGALGVELRSFGHDCRVLACEPTHTDAAKVLSIFDDAGVEPMCIATSIRYDAPVDPPVLGYVFGDVEKPVRQTKLAVEAAAAIGAPFVRVFPFELPGGEKRSGGLKRIVERLRLALTTARHTGTRLVVENGGSFPLASDLAEIIDRASSPLLGAAYNVAAACAAGEDPVAGARMLGDRLETVKLTDTWNGSPVALGDGQLEMQRTVRGLVGVGFGGWLVVEYPRIWLRDLPDPEDAVAVSIERLYEWGEPSAAITPEVLAV